MTVHIYNSLTRKKEEFKPIKPSQVSMYVCGPTVYDEPHIGHARSAYIFDVIRRYLEFSGYKVKFVRNVTDVDDKIIERARKEYPQEELNASFKKVAEKYLEAYHRAMQELGIAVGEPEINEPKASEYIEKMIKFILRLIERGVAYEASGDVYFDITQAKSYGKLSNQFTDKMEIGARVASNESKRDPLDFALWKSAKENEPSWSSPWGRGRPGWHIECSVMSSDILGETFDIHGGGIDLIFPHHENEIAQSEGAGYKFANYWIHHGLLTINGQKMSKSLGNFVTVDSFLEKYSNAGLLKLLFLSTHYSHPVDYNEKKIEEAREALERIIILKDKLASKLQGSKFAGRKIKEVEEIRNKFITAMDDDFNTPQALAAVFELVSLSNKNIDNQEFACGGKAALEELLSVLGISLDVRTKDAISDKEIEAKIIDRNNARKNKDYALSDKIRNELEAQGVILEDAKDGKTTWRRKL